MAQNVTYLDIYFMGPLKKFALCYHWVQCSINVDYSLLSDAIVKFFYILVDFLFVFSINF